MQQKVRIELPRKAFDVLRRQGDPGAGAPNSRFDYSKEVGHGLRSSTALAPLAWIMRKIVEAPMVVRDPDDAVVDDHQLVQLFRRPNRFYGGGILRQAMALDFAWRGDAYVEIERGRGRMPVALFYQPWYQIDPKGSDSELITHYIHHTGKGQRRIEAEDMIHLRFCLDPTDQKHGLSPYWALVREVFTDDEAANFTAAVLRNFGFPGVVISPKEEGGRLFSKQRQRIRQYFRRMFRGDMRGDVLVTSGTVQVDTMDVDLSKLGIDKLRQIPEERACAVLGVDAAVVGFGTGMEQTKVGATLEQLRRKSYEDAIIPIQMAWAEQLDSQILPEFETDERYEVGFDNSDVMVLQEDQNRRSDRLMRQFAGGGITRRELREELGYDGAEADDVYLLRMSDQLIPANQRPALPPPAETRGVPSWMGKSIGLKGQTERDALNRRLLADWDRLSRQMAAGLAEDFERIADEVASAWERHAAEVGLVLAGRNGHQIKQPDADVRETVDLVLAGTTLEPPDYAPHYLSVLQATVGSVNAVMGLAIDLDDPIERAVVAEGGTRRGLIDMTEQTRASMYSALEEARQEGMGPVDSARMLRERISAGPWGSVQTRAMVIARTEIKFAQNVSALTVYEKSDTITGVQVYDAQLGDTDADCMAINGRILSMTEARGVAPLDHPNCFPGSTMVLAPNVAAVFARWFDGEVVVLRTAADDLLTCTPNHPILTDRGWVAAGMIDQRDYVFRAVNGERVANLLDPDHDHMPSMIEQVAGAFAVTSGMPARRVPTSAEDFHGDGGNGYVDVVGADGHLQPALASNHRSHLTVEMADAQLPQLTGVGARGLLVDGVDAAPGGFVGGAGIGDPLRGGALRRGETLGISERPQLVSTATECLAKAGPWAPERGAEFLGTLSGLIAPVQILEVKRQRWSGHVYNLQTSEGWYQAEGLVVHNCTRNFAPVVGD